MSSILIVRLGVSPKYNDELFYYKDIKIFKIYVTQL